MSLFSYNRKYRCPDWVLGGLKTSRAKRQAAAEWRETARAVLRRPSVPEDAAAAMDESAPVTRRQWDGLRPAR